MRVDEDGWCTDALTACVVGAAYHLFAKEPGALLDGARFRHAARTFFGASIELAQAKKYPLGVGPCADVLLVDVAPLRAPREATRVRVVCVPLAEAPSIGAFAEAAVRAVGGAGFDALLARAVQLWQVEAALVEGHDARAPLVCAGVLANVLLAPIVPPEGLTVFAVKSARAARGARLAHVNTAESFSFSDFLAVPARLCEDGAWPPPTCPSRRATTA